ncbi:uncharacterized protein LOC117178912 [Belonocnema kinseyi]|uniref:uncharacterized protein LOC117178912 n=1 Tax=Belonocnema kinseyi TaxID=2817044 RepID=UPI00143D0031|nr:uncharacterized protein LOC117178912 [Belonocnema kinseyi]
MGWSKRGNGRSYDSLSDYGTIIGFLTGKILDFSTRNRKYRLCDKGHSKQDHDCVKNFQGSAKAMEPDVGGASGNNSIFLKEASLSVRVLIGDEDSSTIAAKSFKELGKKETISHSKKLFTYAVSQNHGKSSQLTYTLRTIPDHVFGHHENCGSWCKSNSEDNSLNHTIQLKDLRLHSKLTDIFSQYANNPAKFSVFASSQANESLNNMMAHKAAKNRSYDLSESADYRSASAVCTRNEGEINLLSVQEKCVYLNPSGPVDSEASNVTGFTGLRNIAGQLYCHGELVSCIHVVGALTSFAEFLNLSSKPCLLVAHNAPFDSSRLLRYIKEHNMINIFLNIVEFLRRSKLI